jgi:Flp pilus assembly pilin Flp
MLVFAAVEFCCLAKLVSDVLVAFVSSITFVTMVPLVLIEM